MLREEAIDNEIEESLVCVCVFVYALQPNSNGLLCKHTLSVDCITARKSMATLELVLDGQKEISK